MKSPSLNSADQKRLIVAEGWLELGSWLEADAELENIAPESRAHPKVMELRYRVYARAKRWHDALEVANALTQLLPNKARNWIHKAEALRALGRQTEAQGVLLSCQAMTWSADEVYELAVEAGKLECFEAAIALIGAQKGKVGFAELKGLALETPALEPIHARLKEL
jgi:predicted Zn-dependent protease